MTAIKLNYRRMKTAQMRKYALGFGGGAGGSGGGFSGGGQSGGFGFGGGNGTSSHGRFNPVFDDLSEGTIVEQFMPVDFRRLHRIWRRIRLQDPVAGPAVDLYSDLPWSEFQFTGLEDREIANVYTDAMNNLDITNELPGITGEFLGMGKVIGHLIMDEIHGVWDRMIIHDPDWIRVSPIPVPGFQPKLDIIPTPDLKAWANSTDERDQEAQDEVEELAAMIRNGQDIPLPTENSFYLPRKTSPYDVIGASVYTRIIMFVAYEKALINATIAASRRRASRIRHITAGIDDVWEPSADELDDLSSLFMQADEDPVGAVVVTRTGVSANEVGGGSLQDITKISDEWDFLLKGKLNALGVSESFITGDATYNSLEQLMSVFLERVKVHRKFIERNLIFNKLLLPLAKRHGFVQRKTAEISHRIRVAHSKGEEKYILPTIAWDKSLRPVADRDYLEILQMMNEKGIPITKRTWTAAAGFDLESEMEQFDDDIEVSRRLIQQKKKMAQVAPAEEAPGGLGGGLGGDMGGLGGLGGADMGLEGLGGGDMGGLGGDALGGGGDMGGLGGDALGGGGDMGGGAASGGGLELPSVGASAKSASYEVAAAYSSPDPINALGELVLWGPKKEFLGVTLDQAAEHTKSLLGYLEGHISKKVTRGTARELIRTGNNRRDQVLRYILTRSGLLHNADINRDVAKDIHKELMRRFSNDPQTLATELRVVASCAQLGVRNAIDDSDAETRAMLKEAAKEVSKKGSSANKLAAKMAKAVNSEKSMSGINLLTGRGGSRFREREEE